MSKFVEIEYHAFRKDDVCEIYHFGNRIRVRTIHGGVSEIHFPTPDDASMAYTNAMKELNT